MLTILLAVVFLHESLSLAKGAGIVCIAAGTYLMIEKKQSSGAAKTGASWLLYAAGSAVFASLTSILGKVGISGVESNLGTAIRTGVVLVMSWMMVFVTGKGAKLREVPKGELGFICLSGLATGGSWLCYYKALQDGPASVVAPIHAGDALTAPRCRRRCDSGRAECRSRPGTGRCSASGRRSRASAPRRRGPLRPQASCGAP